MKQEPESVRVQFLGPARDWVGTSFLELSWPETKSVAHLLQRLQKLFPAQSQHLSQVAICINEEVASSSHAVHKGDEIVVLPPVCGGSSGEAVAFLSPHPLEVGRLLQEALDPEAGGVASFVGVVRSEGPRQVKAIWYEAFTPLAAKQLKRIAEGLQASHLLKRIKIVHRLGEVRAGEAAVVIVATAGHRHAALDAVREAIERVKKEVPIWKRECCEDGTEAWVEGRALRGNLVGGCDLLPDG